MEKNPSTAMNDTLWCLPSKHFDDRLRYASSAPIQAECFP